MEVSEKPQYRQVAKLLEKRIRHGDYLLKELPASRLLAVEMGVSHIVARKAMELLANDGLLTRKPNGRLTARPSPTNRMRQARLAFVSPAFESPAWQLLRATIQRAVSKAGAMFRPVDFVHWNDPVFDDVLEGFDGAFIIPSTDPIPPDVADRLGRSTCRLATFELSLAEHGIPVISLFELSDIHCLLDHLYDRGHRRIGCFNTQPEDAEILARIDAWRQWMKQRGLSGLLVSDPVQSYERAIVRAYQTGKRIMQQAVSDCTALFCPTEAAAKGLARAMADCGLKPGRDLSICTLDDECEARYFIPTLTSIQMSDLSSRVAQVLDWMMHPDKAWKGNLKLCAADPQLLIGESVGSITVNDQTK